MYVGKGGIYPPPPARWSLAPRCRGTLAGSSQPGGLDDLVESLYALLRQLDLPLIRPVDAMNSYVSNVSKWCRAD